MLTVPHHRSKVTPGAKEVGTAHSHLWCQLFFLMHLLKSCILRDRFSGSLAKKTLANMASVTFITYLQTFHTAIYIFFCCDRSFIAPVKFSLSSVVLIWRYSDQPLTFTWFCQVSVNLPVTASTFTWLTIWNPVVSGGRDVLSFRA